MEVFLLLLDELDDVAGVIRHVWRRVLGLMLAIILFAATGWIASYQPRLAVVAVAGVLSFALLDRVRRRMASRLKRA